MIVDKFTHIRDYSAVLPNLENALAVIAQLPNWEVGRYEFDGGFLMVQRGSTKPLADGLYEAHRRFIDVQIIMAGSEEMAWEDVAQLTSQIAYNPEKDIEHLQGNHDHVLRLTAGEFYAVFPHDGHQPVAHTATPQNYTKIVVKLALDK